MAREGDENSKIIVFAARNITLRCYRKIRAENNGTCKRWKQELQDLNVRCNMGYRTMRELSPSSELHKMCKGSSVD
jgi:hypothetical protein